MEIKGKVHLFFEQSGTFKNEFIKLGITAEDYDIQNNFGQTDHIIDLFHEIEEAYRGGQTVFDNITKDDLIMAFFPCIYFENRQMTYYSGDCINLRGKGVKDKFDIILERISNRERFLILLYKLFAICEIRNLRLILENPATQPSYLLFTQNFYKRPTIIDKNRLLRGDFFKKPTAYWFFNCQNTTGFSFQKDKKQLIIEKCKHGIKAGLCSEERSMISPDYARNFICDFIIGKKQNINQLTLF